MNDGYLKASRTLESDSVYTPREAILPLLEFIPKEKTIWCPFDEDDSEFVKVFKENGFQVINSHINYEQDFFSFEPAAYDLIVSNPPYSIKDKVLKRLYELNKPYAMLLPLSALQGQKRFPYIKDCQALIFNKRLNFFKDKEKKEIQKGISFATIYICRKFLPKDLIFKEL